MHPAFEGRIRQRIVIFRVNHDCDSRETFTKKITSRFLRDAASRATHFGTFRESGVRPVRVHASDDMPLLFRGRTYPLKQADIVQLLDSRTTTLYVQLSEQQAYGEYLRNEVLPQSDLASECRFRALADINCAVFESAFHSQDVGHFVDFAASFGSDLAEVVNRDETSVHDLMELMSHDYCTFTHVANVTTYCVALARALGTTDQTELQEIAVGGLLHDYGKRFLSLETLNYPGRLTKKLFQEVMRHPHDGFCQLNLRRDLSWGQLMMVYQHHERPDGKGYPVGVEGDEIHPLGADLQGCRRVRRAHSRSSLPAGRCARRGTAVHAFQSGDRIGRGGV